MEEGSMNFKALRARFQEEALLAQSRASRPAVAEKPKHLLTPGGHYSSVGSSVNNAGESKTPVGSHVLYRDGLRASGSRRPISFQPQPQKTSPLYSSTGENTKKLSLKDRSLPLVLPALPVNDQRREPPTKEENKREPEKDALPQTKIKKKGLLLPFKSAKASKVSENEEVPTHVDLTTRPWTAATELPSVEKQNTEEGVSFHSDQSTSECPRSSPDITVTPPPSETSMEVDSKVMSTLEWARRKFSYRQMIISSIPKSLRSPGSSPRDEDFPSPPKNIDCSWGSLPVPPPVCLPHLACISARPFSKANLSTRKVALDTQLGREKVEYPSPKTAESPASYVPQKKFLPDLNMLGLQPSKPTRPPVVNLSGYYPPCTGKMSSCSNHMIEGPEPEQPSIPTPVLDFAKFPDFEIEKEENEAVDIATLDLDVLDFASIDIPPPVDEGSSSVEGPQPDLSALNPAEASGSYVIQDLNLGSPDIIPLHPASFPEPINLSEFPGPWSQSSEVLVDSFSKSHSDETDLVETEGQSVPEETELSSHATWSDGNQTQSSMHNQDSFCETYDNVYEDVENMSKYILDKNVCQRKVQLKNPHMVHHIIREDPSVTKRQRNHWVGVPIEHPHLIQNNLHSKEPQSPSTVDYKEQKKREKQRLEKERKELKEREKKENEMRKKFKVTGDEEPMYDAVVMVDSKTRKHDLPVKSGDTVSIIRITNCPKGKWLARDANHKYGYISVMNVVLNMEEMREFGKKAQAAGRGGNMEGDNISIGSRSSSHRVLTSSFTDDSEEWACEDETMSPGSESHSFAQTSGSAPGISGIHVGAQHTLSDASLEDLNTRTRHEALQKLAIFFQHKRNEFGDIPDSEGATPTNDEPPNFLHAVEEPPYPEQEVDFTDLEFLPPPPLYADTA